MIKKRILDPTAFLRGLGSLHDCEITNLDLDAKSDEARLEIADILSNFQDGEGANVPLKATLIFDKPRVDAEFLSLMAERRTLWIWECHVIQAKSLLCEFKFVPNGTGSLNCASIALAADNISTLKSVAPMSWETLESAT